MADAGAEVTLLEAKNHLGGRAHSFQDRETGACIDNCQHVLLGCCEEAIAFFERIGSADKLEFRDTIRLITASGREIRIKKSALPAPFHLAPSLFASDLLSAGDKLGLMRAMTAMRQRIPAQDVSAAQYLMSIGCPERVVETLFEPILISALNEDLKSASAADARFVLLKSLVENRESYRLGVFRAPLGEVLETRAATYLARKGCKVWTSAKVVGVNTAGARITGLNLNDGRTIRCDACVAAVPPWSLAETGIAGVDAGRMQWRAIVGVHLFLDDVDNDFDCACVAGEPFGWVFNKTADFGLRFACLHAVASAADGIVDMPKDALVEMAVRAAGKAAGWLQRSSLRRAVVYRAQRATFSTQSAGMRPANETQLANLVLAGDSTDTGWPSTMESAVRSGRAAARAVIRTTDTMQREDALL